MIDCYRSSAGYKYS